MKTLSVLIIAFFGLSSQVTGQVASTSELYKTIIAKDSLLFTIGFNTCDLSQFINNLSEDFEFYHDKGGITTTKAEFIINFENGLCKSPESYQSRRELIQGSSEIFPLKDNGKLYGAIQKGDHRFFEKVEEQAETFASTAKFTHLWILENNEWKLSRSLSYDHQNFDDSVSQQIKQLELQFDDQVQTEQWLIEQNIPAMGIGFIEDGKIKEIKVFGELEKGVPAPKNTIFNVASLTKPITALVTLKLVDSGLWNLDEPIYKYWIDPDIKDDPYLKKLTTRHILSHQTGFPNWRRLNDDGKLGFQFEPGTQYQYSGEGMEYLREALERKFVKALEELASELIFEPLQMKDTRLFWDQNMDEKRFAKWFNSKGEQYETYKNDQVNAADDLLTTVEDYSKFMLYVMNGAGLSSELIKEMSKEQVKVKKGQHFGLGWSVDTPIGKNEYALTHGGDDIGVKAICFVLPKTKRGLLIITNSDNGVQTYIPAIKHYLGEAGEDIISIETNQ
ncbi:serine hydrolase [Ulvibacter antarcticus]|uniref:CubicO group peptidase (Beta-lactamase class C family) n=1 Tax=Ulvibacter antarcticus TaxID=442714 RepID=A0A3L9ZDL1_9FLAO|nr:serine hydrolase [Ulvibacter antarcticus]RMA64752.1 CubicO group peptidase (beta-lactamase class C family) [Ulvibacter antarcticus]